MDAQDKAAASESRGREPRFCFPEPSLARPAMNAQDPAWTGDYGRCIRTCLCNQLLCSLALWSSVRGAELLEPTCSCVAWQYPQHLLPGHVLLRLPENPHVDCRVKGEATAAEVSPG